MSYDISLYRRDFLKRAIENNLGDWTGSEPIPDDVIRAIVMAAEREQFIRAPVDEAFAAFAREKGFALGAEFLIDTPTLQARLTLFAGSVTFSIPSGQRAQASVGLCLQLARRLALDHQLGFYDPQAGEALYE